MAGLAAADSSEVALALFQPDSGEDLGGCDLVGAGVVFVSETEEVWGVFDHHEGALEVANDIASVVGLCEDDLDVSSFLNYCKINWSWY